MGETGAQSVASLPSFPGVGERWRQMSRICLRVENMLAKSSSRDKCGDYKA